MMIIKECANSTEFWGLSLFLISSYGYMEYTKWQLRNSYSVVLKQLFKSGAKPPNRHHINSEGVSVDKQFEVRKKYFKSLLGDHLKNKIVGCCQEVEKLVHYIHIVGTKGKGSTGEYIRCGLHYYNKRIGVFTSPHMHTARERIKVSDELISIEDIVRLGNKALQHPATKDCSWVVFFDYFLTMALYYFEEQKVNFVLMEGGIGGRYDSTNFIDSGLGSGTEKPAVSDPGVLNSIDDLRVAVPLVVVITNISIDHQSVLGYSIEEIAMQKCGVIKPNSYVFTCVTSQRESVMNIIRRECLRLEAVLYEVDTISMSVSRFIPCERQNEVNKDGAFQRAVDTEGIVSAQSSDSHHIDTTSENRALASAVLLHFAQVGLFGTHAGSDSTPAVAAVTPQDLNTLPGHIYDDFFWPCRMEKFDVPYNVIGTGNTVEVILDGCHNGYSVYKFMDTLGRILPRQRIITLFGCGSEKEEIIREMVNSVCRTSDTVILVRSTHFKAMDVKKLNEYIPLEYRSKIQVVKPFGEHMVYVSDILSCLLESRRNVDAVDLPLSKIAVCGSLFVAAEAREYLYENFKSRGLFRPNDWVQYCKLESW